MWLFSSIPSEVFLQFLWWGHGSVLSLLSLCRSLRVCQFLLCPAGILHNALWVKGSWLGVKMPVFVKLLVQWGVGDTANPKGHFTFWGMWAPFLTFFGLGLSFECDCTSQCWTSGFIFLTAFFFSPVPHTNDSRWLVQYIASVSCFVSMNATLIENQRDDIKANITLSIKWWGMTFT